MLHTQGSVHSCGKSLLTDSEATPVISITKGETNLTFFLIIIWECHTLRAYVRKKDLCLSTYYSGQLTCITVTYIARTTTFYHQHIPLIVFDSLCPRLSPICKALHWSSNQSWDWLVSKNDILKKISQLCEEKIHRVSYTKGIQVQRHNVVCSTSEKTKSGSSGLFTWRPASMGSSPYPEVPMYKNWRDNTVL